MREKKRELAPGYKISIRACSTIVARKDTKIPRIPNVLDCASNEVGSATST